LRPRCVPLIVCSAKLVAPRVRRNDIGAGPFAMPF
jgi:hypothetical protein